MPEPDDRWKQAVADYRAKRREAGVEMTEEEAERRLSHFLTTFFRAWGRDKGTGNES